MTFREDPGYELTITNKSTGEIFDIISFGYDAGIWYMEIENDECTIQRANEDEIINFNL